MTCIYLYVRRSCKYQAGGCVTVTVSREDYTCCKLFHKYTHTLCLVTEGCIYVFKGGWNFKNYLTLTTDGPYKSACLEKVEVYFNKHENKTPLLFVLHFAKNGEKNGAQNRYYRMSFYDTDAKECKTKKIEGLCEYTNEQSILCALIQENDTLKDFLTYDIMQRPNANNGDGTSNGKCTYNCGKIEVTKDTNGQPKLTNGFTRYVHKPAANGQSNGNNQSKKACLTYRCQALLGSDKTELGEIQNKQYTCLKVYFGTKAKRECTQKAAVPGEACTKGQGDTCTKGEGSSTCPPATTGVSADGTCPACPAPTSGTTNPQDVPLMLELHKPTSNGDGSSNDPDYYVHRRKANGGAGNGDQYYWVKLNGGNNGNGELKDVLTDIGLDTGSNGLGNGKLKEKLGQQVNGAGDSNGQPNYLTLLLKRLEFDLTDSVVILMDKRNGSSSSSGGYDDAQIQAAIKNLQPPEKQTGINPLKLGNGGSNGKITVSDAQNGLCKCLTDYKYRVVAHDFKKAVSKLGEKCWAGLRFLTHTKDNGSNYAQLRLYSTDTKAANLEYIYYTRNGVMNGGSDHNCAKAYVVFYGGTGGGGTDSDPRPLLLCYGRDAYKPKDKKGYDKQQWVKVPGLSLKKCLCENGDDGDTDPQNQALLKAVTGVVGFLNTVNLYNHPNGTSTSKGQTCPTGGAGTTGAVQECQPVSNGASTTGSTCTYTVHTYQSKPIKVQVTCCPVKANGSQSCYRKLTHKPIGTNGPGGAPNGSGFRLGDVEYCQNSGSRRTGSIKYYGNGTANGTNLSDYKWAPLVAVHAYFYTADTGYQDPLLVVLEFKSNGDSSNNGNKECYKLTSSNGLKLTWQKDETAKSLVDKDNGKLTQYLDQIRYCLKQVVRIQLECKASYELKGREAKSTGGFDKPINGGQSVQVKVCDVACSKLSDSHYKCVKHCLTTALSEKQHKVAGLAFTLPGTNGVGSTSACCVSAANGGTSSVANGFVEIPVCVAGQGDAKCGGEGPVKGLCPAAPAGDAICPTVTTGAGTCPASPSTAGTCQPGTIPLVYYNKCMGDVCVYFYACKNGGSEACTVSTDTTASGNCSSTSNGDTVPLMVRFNGQFYRPECRDSYFTKWICVTELCKEAGTCKCVCCCGANADGGGAGCTDVAGCGPDCTCCSKLVTELDKVNEALNRIDLDKSSLANGAGGLGGGSSSSSNCKGYGLPEQNGCQGAVPIRGCKLASTVGNYRICLTKQQPSGDAEKAYTRVIHRTKNGFHIGEITYCGHEIVDCGITPKGQDAQNGRECNGVGSLAGASCSAPSPPTSSDCTIKVANGSSQKHTALVSSNSWNTVAAYYSTTDGDKQLPQLIVILKTDQVKNGGTVTGSKDSGYGYYVLASKNGVNSGGSGYQYQWRLVNGGKPPATEVKLDEATDFSLLNAAIILLEWTSYKSEGNYGEGEISAAVKSSKLTSPGNTGEDVNRLKDKTITVKDETSTAGDSGAGTCAGADSSTSTGACCCPSKCKCLTGTGFKVMTHDLTELVKLNGQFKDPLCKINLITGLRFLIPTRNGCGNYRLITLKDNTNSNGGGSTADTGSVKYHHPGKGDKICVYFYGSDPRPLLVCYNGWAYAPKTKDEYFTQWHKDKEAGECKCTPPAETCDKCPLLKELVAVSDYLNPVDIKKVPDSKSKYSRYCRCYQVHQFNGCRVWVRVSAQPAIGSFCFDRFTHTHAGTTGKGDGFRLGNIHYGNGTAKSGVANGSCIKLNGASTNTGATGKCISASDVDPKTRKPSPEVVVFYYGGDTKHQHPLLVALRSPDNGMNGKHKPYFELTAKSKPTETKLYKKNDNGNGLDLNDTKPEGDLAKKLDSILFNISKKLRVVLAERPVPAKYSATEGYPKELDELKGFRETKEHELNRVADEAAKAAQEAKAKGTTTGMLTDPQAIYSSLTHHVLSTTKYQAQVFEANGSEPVSTPPGPTHTQITVKEVDCPEIHSRGGYRCFKHELMNANNIESVGGLKLALFDGEGAQEITLCNGNGDDKGTTNGKSEVELRYTTCKGDLYVFFYGGIFQKLDLKKVSQNNLVSHIFMSNRHF